MRDEGAMVRYKELGKPKVDLNFVKKKMEYKCSAREKKRGERTQEK